jgi:hypothetical protein
MNSILKAGDADTLFTLQKATVIHANKYTTTHDGGINLPVWSNLHNEIVFRLEDSQEDLHVYVKNVNLSPYSSQEVMIVLYGSIVMAYIDMKTKKYYYTSNDFAGKLNLGMPYAYVWLIGIIGAIAIYFIKKGQPTYLIILPLVGPYIYYRIQKWIIHFKVKKVLDRFLT